MRFENWSNNAGWRGCRGIQPFSKALDQIFDAFSMVCCSAYTYRSTTQPHPCKKHLISKHCKYQDTHKRFNKRYSLKTQSFGPCLANLSSMIQREWGRQNSKSSVTHKLVVCLNTPYSEGAALIYDWQNIEAKPECQCNTKYIHRVQIDPILDEQIYLANIEHCVWGDNIMWQCINLK